MADRRSLARNPPVPASKLLYQPTKFDPYPRDPIDHALFAGFTLCQLPSRDFQQITGDFERLPLDDEASPAKGQAQPEA